MQTRRRTRGAGHGKPSAKKYRQSLRRLEQSIRNADAAAQAAFNAKRMSRRRGMSNIANLMNVGTKLRRSTRRVVASSAMKSLRERALEKQAAAMKEIARSFQKVVKNAKAAERSAKAAEHARTNIEMSNLMRRFGL